MIQTSFIDIPAKPAPRTRKTAAQRRAEREAAFRKFDSENPHVYTMLREMALRLKRAGHKRWGIRCIWERLRYELAIQTTESKPRLNDHLPPFFARKLMAENAELADFFETRND